MHHQQQCAHHPYANTTSVVFFVHQKCIFHWINGDVCTLKMAWKLHRQEDRTSANKYGIEGMKKCKKSEMKSTLPCAHPYTICSSVICFCGALMRFRCEWMWMTFATQCKTRMASVSVLSASTLVLFQVWMCACVMDQNQTFNGIEVICMILMWKSFALPHFAPCNYSPNKTHPAFFRRVLFSGILFICLFVCSSFSHQ